MKFLRDLFIAAMFTLNRYMPAQDKGITDELVETELEPVKQMDEWDRLMHHDDVTKEEEGMLFSNDPEKIHMAQEQIFQRQAEFQEVWDDKDKLKELFQEPYLKDADFEKPQTPMHEKEGWEDDDDMPETFIGYNENGDLEEVRFDDLPEWQNGHPDRYLTE